MCNGKSHDAHDLGFHHDLPRLMDRRKLLVALGGTGVAVVSGGAAHAAACVALPWETAGPYPADGSNTRSGQLVNVLAQEGVLRQDLRSSFGAYDAVAEGVPLELEIDLVDADGCTPLAGHAVYIWCCDAEGLYSLYTREGANYLRGLGVSDADGTLRFTMIFPGCYDGRWPHIHFEVFKTPEAAVSGEASVLTAQMALPESECAAVYAADGRYVNGLRNLGRITLASDNVFSDNGEAALAQQMVGLEGNPVEGYRGSITVPVDFTAERRPGGGGFWRRLLGG